MANYHWRDDDARRDPRQDWRDDERMADNRGRSQWRGGREPWEDRRRGYSSEFDADADRNGREGFSGRSAYRDDYSRGRGSSDHEQAIRRSAFEAGYQGEDVWDDGRPGHRPDTYREDRDWDRAPLQSSGWTGRGRSGHRGFIDRASDEVASWFGDDEAARRRQIDEDRGHSGRGPRGYVRSDERIRDDVNDRLTYDRHVDASDIEVTVANGEVTLNGMVPDRFSKRHAEDIIENLNGVTHVQNNLRVKPGTGAPDAGLGTSARPSTEVRAPYTGNAGTQEPGSPMNRNH